MPRFGHACACTCVRTTNGSQVTQSSLFMGHMGVLLHSSSSIYFHLLRSPPPPISVSALWNQKCDPQHERNTGKEATVCPSRSHWAFLCKDNLNPNHIFLLLYLSVSVLYFWKINSANTLTLLTQFTTCKSESAPKYFVIMKQYGGCTHLHRTQQNKQCVWHVLGPQKSPRPHSLLSWEAKRKHVLMCFRAEQNGVD